MDKIALYQSLLEDHPLWTKEAKKEDRRFTSGEMAGAGGAGLGVGLGGGLLISEDVIQGAKSKARSAERQARHEKTMRGFAERSSRRAWDRASSSSRQARQAALEARRAKDSASFWRAMYRYR
jgi:hypothetical protein